MTQDLSDEHLNLFYAYGIEDQDLWVLENNVTRAFVTTLRLADPRVTRDVLLQLVPELAAHPVDWTDIGFGLQRPPPTDPAAFDVKVVVGISRDGRVEACGLTEEILDRVLGSMALENDEPPAVPVQIEADPVGEGFTQAQRALLDDLKRRKGRPDAWLFSQRRRDVCVLIETKVWGPVYEEQILRHEKTWFRERGDPRRLDCSWSEISEILARAQRTYASPVVDEFLSYLNFQRLSATLRFDAVTIQRLRGGLRLPVDLMQQLVDSLRSELALGNEALVVYDGKNLIFRDFDAVGNIEVWFNVPEGNAEKAYVATSLSMGTVACRPQEKLNRIPMPMQIDRLLSHLCREQVRRDFIDRCRSARSSLGWTVVDRLRRIQSIDWEFRSGEEIAGLVRAAGGQVESADVLCLGKDAVIPCEELDRVARGLQRVHLKKTIVQAGHPFEGYQLYGRAYLEELRVPVYERTPRDVIADVARDCVFWYSVLRILS